MAVSYFTHTKAADAEAANATAETYIGRAPRLVSVRSVAIVGAALTAHGSNNATITVHKRTSAGATQTTVATLATNVAGGNWVAGAPKVFALAAGAASVAAGSSLSFSIAKAGDGVVIPASCLVVEFSE